MRKEYLNNCNRLPDGSVPRHPLSCHLARTNPIKALVLAALAVFATGIGRESTDSLSFARESSPIKALRNLMRFSVKEKGNGIKVFCGASIAA